MKCFKNVWQWNCYYQLEVNKVLHKMSESEFWHRTSVTSAQFSIKPRFYFEHSTNNDRSVAKLLPLNNWKSRKVGQVSYICNNNKYTVGMRWSFGFWIKSINSYYEQ